MKWLDRRRRIRALEEKISSIEEHYFTSMDTIKCDDGQREDVVASIFSAMFSATREYERLLNDIKTKSLQDKALLLGIDLPDDIRYKSDGIITKLGESYLRRKIAEERMHRVGGWVGILAPILMVILGIIGTLVGLISIWKN